MRLSHFIALLFLLQFGVTKDALPVFLIDYDKVMGDLFIEPNAFYKTDSRIFTDIIDDATKQSKVFIIFVEDHFCSADVSAKDENGTPFSYLHEDVLKYKAKYIPNVVNPVGTVKRILKPTQSNVFVMKPGQQFQPKKDLSFFYIFFKDAENERRIETLRRHDSIIQEVYDKTRQIANGAVTALYTGKSNPVMLTDSNAIYGDSLPDVGEKSLLNERPVLRAINHHGQGVAVATSLNISMLYNQPFGPVRRCNPYFNPGIIASITISAMCIGVLLKAVSCLFNCHTNDRYDDAYARTPIFSSVE
ncbi:uncharacterized protein LOC132902014 [Amyelois transitella]|uniref:uncharacterized protein LOC132902014 n=1 Tax=Amyelois transitella TaxID=680683 RepID=UPI00298F84F0|nr:uncharacterized protein LOC132902014 [Amyelois transitella]